MKKFKRGLGLALLVATGVAATVAAQAWGIFPYPVDFDGAVHPLYKLHRAVYPVATLAIGGIAALFLTE